MLVYADRSTRIALNWIDNLLRQFCGIEWRDLNPDITNCRAGAPPASATEAVALQSSILPGLKISVSAIPLPESIAFQLRDENSGKSAVIAPAVGELTDHLREAIHASDVILFDGTFWSNDELSAVRAGARTAQEMHHLPIRDGSLDLLRSLSASRKVYTHINNTNPILMPGSEERQQVEKAGVEIGFDGMEIVL